MKKAQKECITAKYHILSWNILAKMSSQAYLEVFMALETHSIIHVAAPDIVVQARLFTIIQFVQSFNSADAMNCVLQAFPQPAQLLLPHLQRKILCP